MEQIQAEYKKLALELHPDKNNGDKEAEAKFQKLKVSLRESDEQWPNHGKIRINYSFELRSGRLFLALPNVLVHFYFDGGDWGGGANKIIGCQGNTTR